MSKMNGKRRLEEDMRLKLNNIGLFQEATVDIDGITVIAGENGTGKSTIGKSLYAIFNGFGQYSGKIRQNRVRNISNLLSHLNIALDSLDFKSLVLHNNKLDPIAESIVDNRDRYLEDHNLLLEDFIKTFEDYKISKDSLKESADGILESLKLSEEIILQRIITNALNDEFNYEINNIYNTEKASISLEIKKEEMTVELLENQVVQIINPKELVKNVVYIDDPYVLDDLNDVKFKDPQKTTSNHREDSSIKLMKQNGDLIEQIKVDGKLESIFDKLENIKIGNLILQGGIYKYDFSESGMNLDVRNIATGLKTFVILKTLLENGSLEEKGTIILDEPEIHLHPSWQLFLAEIIVLIQKEFNMHILLNTHSPYFLRAIEVYSKKYGVEERTKYYLTSREQNTAFIRDVTSTPDEMYKLLADPLDILREEEENLD